MKIILLIFLMLLLPVAAHGEMLVIGDARIPYRVPPGFVAAPDVFPLDLAALDREFGRNTIVAVKYLPATDYAALKKDPSALPGWYIHLAYDSYFEQHTISSLLFRPVTSVVASVIERQYNKTDFKDKVQDVFSKATHARMYLSSLKNIGFMEKKDGVRSLLAVGYSKRATPAGFVDYNVATMTTFVMNQGKMYIITQIAPFESEGDIVTFARRALQTAAYIREAK